MRRQSFMFICCLILAACSSRETKVDKAKLLGHDYRLYQDSPAWELAKAVEDDDFKKVIEITHNNKQLLNFIDPVYGSTLLMNAIFRHQFEMAETLIEQGADVNIHDKFSGKSAIILACQDRDVDVKIVSVLLEHGANVNDLEVGDRKPDNTTRNTPLMAASRAGNLPLVTFLVSYGADINFKNEYGHTAMRWPVILEKYDIILYLLKKGFDTDIPITYNPELKKNFYIQDELRFKTPTPNSTEYKQKQEIISFLKTKGIDYQKVPIPEYVIQKAKEKYPDSWQEYLKNY